MRRRKSRWKREEEEEEEEEKEEEKDEDEEEECRIEVDYIGLRWWDTTNPGQYYWILIHLFYNKN